MNPPPVTLTLDALNQALERAGYPAEGQLHLVAGVLAGATERERAACWPSLRTQIKRSRVWWDNDALRIAVLGTAPDARAADSLTGGTRSLTETMEAASAVLMDRRPAWLQQFSDQADVTYWFPVLQALIEASLIRPLDGVRHLTGVITYSHWWTANEIRAALLNAPGNPNDNVCGLLMRDDTSFDWLDEPREDPHGTPHGLPPGSGWGAQIVALAQEGVVDRADIHRICLTRLTEEPDHHRVRRFGRLVTELEPSVDDLARQAPLYEQLLRAEASTLVTIGQQAIARLLEAGRIAPSSVVDASAAPLNRREKKLVLAQLSLLQAVARLHPAFADDVCRAAGVVLGHERSDLQEIALRAISALASDAVRPEIAPQLADLAPSVQPLAAELGWLRAASPLETGGAEAGGAEAGPDLEGLAAPRIAAIADPGRRALLERALHQAVSGEPPDPWPLDETPSPGTPLPPPISELDELVRLFSELMERADDPIAAERCVAGALRTCGLPLEDRRRLGAPIRPRAAKLNDDPYAASCYVSFVIAVVAHAWCTGEAQIGRPAAVLGVNDVLPRWINLILADIRSGHAHQLLAESTHDSGAITGSAFLDRLGSAPHWQATAIDLDLTALRLEPGLGPSFWAQLAGVPDGAALVQELQTRYERVHSEAEQPELTVVIGPTTVRAEWERPAPPIVATRFQRHRPFTLAQSTGVWYGLTHGRDPLTTSPWRAPGSWDASYTAQWPTVAPWHPELILAHAVHGMSNAMHPGRTGAAAILNAIRSERVALGPMAHTALVIGLNGHAADTRAAAADTVHVTARDGRLHPGRAAAALVTLAEGGVLKLGRVVAALTPVAMDPAAGYRVLELLSAAIGPLAAAGTRDLQAALALLAGLTARFGAPADLDGIRSIAQRPGRTRQTTEARRILASSTSDPEVQTAAWELLDGMISRAERLGSRPG